MLRTIGGYWDPVVWVVAFIVILIIAYMVRAFGRREYKKGEQIKPFLSGVEEPSKEKVHVRGGNIYWGFIEALRGYYDYMKKMHSGIVNDYVAWFVGVAAIIFVAMFVVVMI